MWRSPKKLSQITLDYIVLGIRRRVSDSCPTSKPYVKVKRKINPYKLVNTHTHIYNGVKIHYYMSGICPVLSDFWIMFVNIHCFRYAAVCRVVALLEYCNGEDVDVYITICQPIRIR